MTPLSSSLSPHLNNTTSQFSQPDATAAIIAALMSRQQQQQQFFKDMVYPTFPPSLPEFKLPDLNSLRQLANKRVKLEAPPTCDQKLRQFPAHQSSPASFYHKQPSVDHQAISSQQLQHQIIQQQLLQRSLQQQHHLQQQQALIMLRQDATARHTSPRNPTHAPVLANPQPLPPRDATSSPAQQEPEQERPAANSPVAVKPAPKQSDEDPSSSSDEVPRVYNCPHSGCTRTFAWKWSMETHARTHLGDEGRTFKCKFCGKGFFTVGCLKSHTKIHTRVAGSYVCKSPGCSKTYSTAEGLRLHIRNHHQVDKKWVCEYPGCTRSFVRHADLRLHCIRIHSKERPFPCTVEGCKKAFACFSELKRHLTCHTRPRKRRQSSTSTTSTGTAKKKKTAAGPTKTCATQPAGSPPATTLPFPIKSLPVKTELIHGLPKPVTKVNLPQHREEYIAAQALANLLS